MGSRDLNLFRPNLPKSANALEELRNKNNPNKEPVGIFTGRCKHCSSNNLWDDNFAYGCDDCGALLGSNF